MAPLDQLRDAGLLDPGVLAVGLEHRWITRAPVIQYAVDRLSAGDDRAEVVELAAAEDLETDRVVALLWRWAKIDRQSALRRWMFAYLKDILEGSASPEEKLDRVEELYAHLGYPEDMRECSRYYVPTEDRARKLAVGEVTASPLAATRKLVSSLEEEFRHMS